MASILVIDDEEDVRCLLVAFLTRLGHVVRQADDGAVGLKLNKAQPADLIITDLVMPTQEGLGTIRELRRINPTARIVAMSGGFASDPRLYLDMAKKLGADRVLRKPFQLPELQAAVEETLAGPAPAK
jgi:CheY-like chemotaxis protein